MPGFLSGLAQPMFDSALANGDVGKAQIALKIGADPNQFVSTPPLNEVAMGGNLILVELLLHAKASLTAKDADGDTALLCALRGADPSADPQGKSHGKKPANQMLEGAATAKAKAWTPAVANSGKKVADKTTTWVLDDGGNIADRGGQRGQRKLPVKAPEIIAALVAAGANVNVSSTGGMTYRQTPLMLAAQWGNPTIVRTLLNARANVNAFDSDGETVLMYAAAEGVGDVLAPLLAAGAKVNAQNTAGFTALHVAAQYNRARAVTMLLTAGADINIKNHKGMTPVDLAVAMRSAAAAKAMVEATQPDPKPGAGPGPTRP